MTQPIFYITTVDNPDLGDWTAISIGGAGLVLVDEEVSEMEFSRETLSGGKMKFTRDGFDFIDSSDFEAFFTIVLMDGLPPSVVLAEWVGEFHKTDCEFFPDDSRVEVLPITVDKYQPIMDSMSKEFDLIQYAPPLTELQLTRRAILQIYVAGASFVTNYVDSAFWETEAINPSSVPSTIAGVYRFGYYDRFYYVTGLGLSPDVSGLYFFDSGTGDISRVDGVYKIFTQGVPPHRTIIARASDNVFIYESEDDETIPRVPVDQEQGVVLTNIDDGVTQVRAFYVDFYTRVLTNKTDIGGDATYAIPADDIVEEHGVFTRIHQKAYADFLISEGNSDDGTRWGKFPLFAQHFAEKHYTRPTGGYYPILQSRWFDTSFWIHYNVDLLADMEEASETYTIKNCYKLSDVISTLLVAMGSTATHEATAIYSDFLYAASNAIRGIKKIPIIIPITNVLVKDYEEPQPVAKITFQDISELMKKAWRAYWYIDSENRFRVEHKYFFENGGSYSGEVIGVDLTTDLEAYSKRPWGTDQNSYKYEKENMPERFEYSWQGKSSKPFLGYPMDIISRWAEKGNIEKWDIGRFSADIDLIHVGGSELSKDGFLFVEALQGEVLPYVPFVTVTIDADEEYILQNGYAAFVWLVPNLHRYGLPAPSIVVNRYPSTALTVARRKLQEVMLSTSKEVTTLELTTTGLGNGKAYRVEREIFGNKKKIALRHNTQ